MDRWNGISVHELRRYKTKFSGSNDKRANISSFVDDFRRQIACGSSKGDVPVLRHFSNRANCLAVKCIAKARGESPRALFCRSASDSQ